MAFDSLVGKRVLITQADNFMGPALCEVFAEYGAHVIADTSSLVESEAPAKVVTAAGHVDILIINLAIKAPSTLVHEVSDGEWEEVFKIIVDPLPRLVRAVLPQMMARKAGKILVMGSASALRGMKQRSTYSAARGSQLAYVQAVGVEMATLNIQVNAIAQNFVENPTYFPPETQAEPAFQERLKREVPLGRLVTGREDAQFAAYLCTDSASCFVGQVFPVCGAWVVR
jgi:2-keto-3-deoxy-L-fuconate dehydrogenase